MMAIDRDLTRGWIRTGAYAGLATGCTYFARYLPLPDFIHVISYFSFGPLLCIASVGAYHFLKKDHDRVLFQCFVLFNIIAGVVVTLMFVVQSANMHAHSQAMARLTGEESRKAMQAVFAEVFSVQVGIGMVWDIFISVGTLLLGVGLLSNRGIAKPIGGLATMLGLCTLAFNVYAWPVANPKEIGLIDLGPYIGGWYMFMVILLFREGFLNKGNAPE